MISEKEILNILLRRRKLKKRILKKQFKKLIKSNYIFEETQCIFYLKDRPAEIVNYLNLNAEERKCFVKKIDSSRACYTSKGRCGDDLRNNIYKTLSWGLILSNNWNGYNDFNIESFPQCFKRIGILDGFPSRSERRRMNVGGRNVSYYDRGHLVGKLLGEYMYEFRNVEEVRQETFFSVENLNNIYVQAERANSGFQKRLGQLQFEQKLASVLSKKDREVNIYYQVEAVFFNENDKIPIGNKLYALRFGNNLNNIEVIFNVFIPNIQDTVNIFDYKNGYITG